MAKSGWDKWRASKQREAKRLLKRKSARVYVIIAIIALLIGFAGSYYGMSVICKNDAFEINGEQVITFAEGEPISYKDEGMKYISFGHDLSDDVKIECELKLENGTFSSEAPKVGEYPIIYTAVGGRCDGQTLYRVIKVVAAETEG